MRCDGTAEDIARCARRYGVPEDATRRILPRGGGVYSVDADGSRWTLRVTRGWCALAGCEPLQATETVTAPADPGPGAEDELRALEERIGGGSRASGRRRSLALLADLIARGVVSIDEG